MIDYSVLVLFVQILCLPKLAEGIRNDILYPKTNVMRTKTMFVIEIVTLLLFCFMMAGTYVNLDLSNDTVVTACYVYVLANLIAQVMLLKKESHKSNSRRCIGSKSIWMAGMILHSIFLFVALVDFQNNHIWKTVVGGFYIVYGLGYFFFIYFTEKEILNSTYEIRKKEMADTSYAKNKLEPLHEADKEKYRQCKIKEVRKRNGLATLGFGLMAGTITGIMLIIAERRSMTLPIGLFYGGILVIGVGVIEFLWISAEKNVKTMKLYTIYEGMALVVSTNPLTIQYFKPDGAKVIKQVDSQIRQAIPAGTFVKIVIENGRIVKLIKEGRAFEPSEIRTREVQKEKQAVELQKDELFWRRQRLDNKSIAIIIIITALVIIINLWMASLFG